MKKYTWAYDEDAEVWSNGTYDSIEECIQAAAQEADETDWAEEERERPAFVYVGECWAFTPSVDGEYVLDSIMEQAVEFAGEVGLDWDSYDHRKHDEIEELNEQLSNVVIAWQKKYGYEPCFYAVNDSTRYDLPGVN